MQHALAWSCTAADVHRVTCSVRARVCCLQVEMGRWMGADAVRATMMGRMRDAMKEDVEKLLQVGCGCKACLPVPMQPAD